MVGYRRHRLAGGSYFFTVTLRDRQADTLVRYVSDLGKAFRAVRAMHPFRTDAVVVLPDHLHTLWTLPDGDTDYPLRWQAIKAMFTHMLIRRGVALARDARGEYALWQRRYWEHTIRDASDLQRHVDYIHINPVKHGLVTRTRDWPHSSFHRFVRRGLVPPDWGASGPLEGKFGE